MQEKYSHTYTDFNQAWVVWDKERVGDYQDLTAKVLSEYEAYFPTPEFVPLKCQLYSDLLVKAADISLDTTPPHRPTKKSKPSPTASPGLAAPP